MKRTGNKKESRSAWVEGAGERGMERTGSKKESRSAWVEGAGERGMERTGSKKKKSRSAWVEVAGERGMERTGSKKESRSDWVEVAGERGMERTGSEKKKSRSAWVEVAGERGTERTGHRVAPGMNLVEATQAPKLTATSPVIPVLCLPKATVKRVGRAAKQGKANSDDHDKGEMVPLKKSRMKKETGLVVKQDVKRNDQLPQCIERRNNDLYPAAAGSPNCDIPDQHDKVSAKRRLTSASKKKKNQDYVMDLIKENVLENERLRQMFQQHIEKE